MIPKLVKAAQHCLRCHHPHGLDGITHPMTRKLYQVGILTLCENCYKYVFPEYHSIQKLVDTYDRYHAYYYPDAEFLK